MGAEVSSSIPPRLLWTVEQAFVPSVLVNIIQNSIKYCSPTRPLSLDIRAVQSDGMVTLTIRDNGIGIAPDRIDRATMMFQRLSTRSDGLGIGLASVKRTVEIHGGRLRLLSDGETYTAVEMDIPGA